MSFVEFGCLQFREMIMGPQSSSINHLSFKVPGNDIPNWFNHKSVKSSISFWVGSGFPKFALCLGFGMEDNFLFFLIVMSTFPSMVENKRSNIHIFQTSFDHLWFYWSQDSF